MRVAYVDSHHAASRRARLGVRAERDRHGDGDARRLRDIGARLALVEQRAALRQPRARPQERRPFVCQLACQPDRLVRKRRERDRHRHFREHAQPQRPRARRRARQAIARQQRAHLGQRLAQAGDRSLPAHAVQAFRQRRAAGSQAERETAAGGALQSSGGERDSRRCPAPHRDHARAEPDPRRLRRDLREQDRGVVAPRLCDLETLEPDCIGLPREPQDRVHSRFERGERYACR